MARAAYVMPLLLLLAGCTSPADPCALPPKHVVDDVQEDDILVDNGSLVLHASDSRIWLRGNCAPGSVQDIQAGDRVGHDAEELALSDPAQAWPRNIVVG